MKYKHKSIKKILSERPPDIRKEAEQNLMRYLNLVKGIYDRLDEKEKQKLLLKHEWEKRNRNKRSASQNE